MKKLFLIGSLVFVSGWAHAYTTIYNPFTGKLDYVGLSSTISSPAGGSTIKSTDTFVSCNATAGAVSFTLPLASARSGQFLYIDKTDSSANACTIKVAGSDTIAYSTGSVVLNAQGQGVQLISDGVSGWKAPNGLEATPPFVGYAFAPNSAASVTTSSNTVLVAIHIPSPVRMTGIRASVAVASSFWQVGLYDAYGVRIATSSEVSMGGATGSITLPFNSAVNVAPGLYYLAVGSDNTTATFGRNGSACVLGSNLITTNMPMAASITLPGTATPNCFAFAGIVTGGIAQ